MLTVSATNPGPPARRTPIGLRRLRRDLSIFALANLGTNVEWLADVFDLDPSMIRRILRSLGARPGRRRHATPQG